MLYFLIGGCVVCAWAVLSLMGAEHNRQMIEINARVKRKGKRAKSSQNHMAAASHDGDRKAVVKSEAAPPKH